MSLGDLQHVTMLAVARLEEDAFGARIKEELARTSGRSVAVSTIYVTLVRLEERGLVRSERLEAEEGQGGRGRRIFRVTEAGWVALREAREELARVWDGLEPA